MRWRVPIPGLAQWVKDPALPWLWRRPAAIALIRPPAWEPPYAVDVALEKDKIKKKKHGRGLYIDLVLCSP